MENTLFHPPPLSLLPPCLSYLLPSLPSFLSSFPPSFPLFPLFFLPSLPPFLLPPSLPFSGQNSRSASPMMKKRSTAQGDDTPSSSDTASHDYWSIKSGSPSLNRLHVHTIHGNIYSQSPRRGVPPNLSKFAKDKRYEDVPTGNKLVTI